MTQSLSPFSSPSPSEQGELFSILLRLHPVEMAEVTPGAGNQVQAALLDLIRQVDPALAEWLHRPNQRRPYTIGLLQGFNHLTTTQLEEARVRQQAVQVRPGQTYWLRITMLDAQLFHSFAQVLMSNPSGLTLRLGSAHFEISRLLTTAEPGAWAAYSSFADLYTSRVAQKEYHFEFVSPTTFSRGQKSWGKLLKVFPEPAYVFESLARQWELFAPVQFRLETAGVLIRDISTWCEENVVVARYRLETSYLPSSKFGQIGFQGTAVYEVKGMPSASQACWLAALARLALFSGIGYKTTVGMGQARCTNLLEQAMVRTKEEV